MTAIAASTSSIGASIGLRSGLIPWHPSLRAEAASLRRDIRRLAVEKPPSNERARKNPPPGAPNPLGVGAADPDLEAVFREHAVWTGFTEAVRGAGVRRLDAMLAGIQRYRAHPYQRVLPEPPVLWAEGTTRLLDYRPLREGAAKGAVMLVPSLVNRGYVLDLTAERSLARWLAARGIDVSLIDWGTPGADEQDFTLTDYVARLGRAAGHAAEACGREVGLLGYCMGGLLTLPLAAGYLGPKPPIDRLVLLATPWDFHAERPQQARLLASMAPAFEPLMRAQGVLPTDAIQALFGGLDPFLAMKKFAAFARMDPDSDRARAFVALEDWLNDGVPLAAPVARDCLEHWYGQNRPGAGTWRLSGFPVRPRNVAVPTLALVPAGDRIVPPASATALAEAIPGAELERPKAGHIGMIVGGRADRDVWTPIHGFLARTPGAA